ncbi:MAG TPA: type I DNA topoisomerase [Elusimicrobiota bacterium]|nr:type I DNA topoisomerase [Elusimicrobiota bacterium]
MAKSLLIVESPTKEKTIGKILGKNFVIKSSYGHVRDLPTKEFGVDVEKGFAPHYVVLPKAKKIIPELTRLAKDAETVYLATDYDREGESIAWHLSEILKLGKTKGRRITFHEITPSAIKEAMKHPRAIDQALVNAQVARRVLDRVVGYRLSPLLWKKVRRGLSAGRVQSVAVRLLCIREEEIARFVAEEYWTLTAFLEKSGQVFSAALYGEGGKKFDKFAFRHREPLDEAVKKLNGAAFTVSSVEPQERRRSPAPPFTTASLQQDASRRLHFSTSRTMIVAQQLYEGIELGAEGAVGLITYMRTDSVQVAKEAQAEARQWIEKKFGKEHVPPKPRVYKTKNKVAQEAHEAIRPTKPSRTPDEVRDFLTDEQFKLYQLIWQRFMAGQMADAVYDTLTVDIGAAGYVFRAAGRTLRFAGFLAVYGESEDEKSQEETPPLPPLAAGDNLALKELKPEQHFTEPPPRYNEASLVKTLEEHGIGRPSTYAPIIQTILDRGYVRLEDRRFYPTDLGKMVDKQLTDHFPDVVDVGFTAKIEDSLDRIASAEEDWKKVINDFYAPFVKDLERAEKKMERVQIKPVETEEKCPRCSELMVIRENRYGRYLACRNYPTCRTTIALDRDGKKILPEPTSELCPNCGKAMLMRTRGRLRFLACSGYPECRTTFSVDKDGNKIIRPKPEMTDQKCEKCGKPMLKRVGKRGPFLACSGFPRCRNIKKIPA